MYGLRQRPLNLYKYLYRSLEFRGFRKSDHDDYFFTNDKVIILIRVDDFILYSKNKREIEDLIVKLKDEFLLENESNMAGFLGINMDRAIEGKVIFTQTGLIDSILSVTDMEECNHKYIPAGKLSLGEDESENLCR